ncbi:MAG TPA: acyl-CoA reductase, partial [Thermomicrobiaceae bacterium]|nr:acyl-CoA reductase [Thermomicrobiaceae bacterium]
METFDAFHLPGLELPGDQPFRELTFGEGPTRVVARAPVLSPAQIRDLAAAVRAARERRLARLPVLEIANRIARAVNRWLDPYSPYLRDCERLLPNVTGYPVEAIRKGLPALLGGYREAHLRRLLEDELGDPAVIDGFRPRRAAAGLTRAFGPRLTAHVFAGNVPGLPAQSLTCALLVKAASIGKSASEEPIFPVLFARSLAEVDPELAAALAITWWPGGERTIEHALFAEADAVIAYGSEPAIESIRAALPPGRRFIPYGHKISFGLIGREALSRAAVDVTVAAAAYDTAKYDQQGCLSPHLFYLERGGEIEPEEFAARLAA